MPNCRAAACVLRLSPAKRRPSPLNAASYLRRLSGDAPLVLVAITEETYIPLLSALPRPPQVPNIITPNGDGLNEVFRFTGLGPGPWQLQVYSRRGRLVYQQENYQQDWEATGPTEGLYYY